MAVGSFPVARGATGVALAALLLAAAGCGRRGALEAPADGATFPPGLSAGTAPSSRPVRTQQKTVRNPEASATPALSSTLDTTEDETAEADNPIAGAAPIPTPDAPGTRRRGRNVTIPKDPFILDPIL